MTKEEKILKEAEKKARLGMVPDLGGISLPVSRGSLLRAFWLFAVGFVGWLFWESRGHVDGETFLVTAVLATLCLLPSWMWATGKVSGLPIFPIFALGFLPTYVTPLWKGTASLVGYTALEIKTAGWTLAAFLVVSVLVWHQLCVRKKFAPQKILMIEQIRSEWILMLCIIAQVFFEVGIFFFKELGEGIFPVIRGFASSAGRLGLFIFSYQIGRGKLNPVYKTLFVFFVVLILIRQVSSLLISTAIPTVGILFAGYILGREKIPWAALCASFFAIAVLQMGKVEMREQYMDGTKKMSFMDAPAFFQEWLTYGLKNMGLGDAKEAKREDAASIKERGSLIQVMIRVQQQTPSQLPYLEGETYRYIPEMLIPRIFKKEKIWAHAGNMILSVYYGFLDREQIFRTSIAFDPIIEAYANFGYAGVFLFATFMGVLVGIMTNLTAGVPMLSFRFLAGLQLLAVLIASFNTMGVLVTSFWQSMISLGALAIVLMKKHPNPLYAKQSGSGGSKIREAEADDGGSVISGRPSSISRNPSADPVRHPRPQQFVYRKKKN